MDASLYSTAAALRTRWGLAPLAPPRVSLNGLAQPVRAAEGLAMLKVARRAGDEALVGAALAYYAGRGAVPLLRHEGAATLTALLRPGVPLTTVAAEGRDAEALATLVEVAQALHAAPPPAPSVDGFRDVQRWGAAFARRQPDAWGGLPAGLVRAGAARYEALAASQAAPRLLHGDLHHGNVLQDATLGWRAIDPKGALAEPAFEYGAALRNPVAHLHRVTASATIAARLEALEGLTGLPRDRLAGWAFAQAVLAALWAVEDGTDPAPWVAVAGAFAPLQPPG